MAVMTKADFGEEIARKVGTTKREAKLILETIFDSIVKALKDGDEVEIRRFGSFGSHWRDSRTARDLRTGRKIEVPRRRVPHFKASRALKALLNRPRGAAGGGLQQADR